MFDLRYNWMIHFYKRSSFLRYTASPKPATSRLGGARYISCAQSGFFCISVSAGVFLDIGDAGLNKVTGYRQAQREGLMTDGRNTTEVVVGNDKCHYCGRRGHGAKPDLNQKKETCPAFDKNCNNCGKIGHFSRSKACRKTVKVEKVMVQHEKWRLKLSRRCWTLGTSL